MFTCVWLCVGLSLCKCRFTWGPEEDMRSPGAGVTDNCQLMWVLGTKIRSSARAVSTLQSRFPDTLETVSTRPLIGDLPFSCLDLSLAAAWPIMFILNEEAHYFLQSLSAGLLSCGALLLGAFPSCVSSSCFRAALTQVWFGVSESSPHCGIEKLSYQNAGINSQCPLLRSSRSRVALIQRIIVAPEIFNRMNLGQQLCRREVSRHWCRKHRVFFWGHGKVYGGNRIVDHT